MKVTPLLSPAEIKDIVELIGFCERNNKRINANFHGFLGFESEETFINHAQYERNTIISFIFSEKLKVTVTDNKNN